MIRERAKVLSVTGDTVMLETAGLQSCAKCSNGNGCGAGTLYAFFGRKNHQLSAMATVPVNRGDLVMVEIREQALLVSASLMYLLPLVMMVLGVFVVQMFVHNAPETTQIIAAFLGLAGGIMLSGHLSKFYFERCALEPKVVGHCANS